LDIVRKAVATADLNEAIDAFRRGDLDHARALAEQGAASASSAKWQHLLGLIHCRRGDVAKGAEWLCRASDSEPDNADFRIMASRALVDSGRATEVLAMPEPPPITSAAAMALWQVRGEAADVTGDSATSELAWRTIVAAAPADWRAWSNLGNALAAQGRWDEAAEAIEKALGFNPSERPLWRNLAGALTSADRHLDALRVTQDWARAIGPSAEQAILRGGNLVALQRLEEAEQAYREALELAPENAEALQGLGYVYERTGRADQVGEVLDAALAAGLSTDQLGYLPAIRALDEGRLDEAEALLEAVDPTSDPIRWFRLKSRIADRRGRPAEAFAAATAMNRSTADFDGWVRRAAEYRKRLRAISKAIDAPAERPDALDPADLAPVFLVGFPRSGTTLLDTFLMGHSRISVLEELPLIMEVEKVCSVEQAQTSSRETLALARNVYFERLKAHIEPGFDGVVVDKMPLNMLAVPLISALFPAARFIFAQRHPCDAVLSGFMQSFITSEPMASFLTIEGAADFYDAAMTLWTRSIELFPTNCHAIAYEELVLDPEGTLRALIRFLGLPWEDRMLDHRRSAKSRGLIVTPSYNQVTEELSSRAVDRWRLYETQLQPALPLLRPWAEVLGYSAD
jgi:Flp pilus assembly protein TadD